MTTPEFFTTGAPASALSVKVDHYLDFQGVDIFDHITSITTLNKLVALISDPVGDSTEAKGRIDKLVKEAQEAMAPFTNKTELWGNQAVAYLIRKWREAFIYAIVIGRCIKVTNNDYTRFSVDNIKELSFRMAGLAPGQNVYMRDNMDKILNTYVDLVTKLESICVPYWKQLTDIFELLGSFFVDTDPEKKLPSLLAVSPDAIASFALDGTTSLNTYFSRTGNNMSDMLSNFEALIDSMSVIEVDGKNYASDMKTALAKAYKTAPVKKGFFVEYIRTPLAWYAHKLKAAQFRNASIVPMNSVTADLSAGTLTCTVDSTLAPEIKCGFDKITVDLYTDSGWKDFSKALAAQMAYCPAAVRTGTTFAFVATTGIIFQNMIQWRATNSYDDTITGYVFSNKWTESHSTMQETATKGLRGWMAIAQAYSDAPLEFADHQDETWFTGKIDDMVQLSKEQLKSIANLMVSCMTRIRPSSAKESLEQSGNKSGPKKGQKGNKKPQNSGKE